MGCVSFPISRCRYPMPQSGWVGRKSAPPTETASYLARFAPYYHSVWFIYLRRDKTKLGHTNEPMSILHPLRNLVKSFWWINIQLKTAPCETRELPALPEFPSAGLFLFKYYLTSTFAPAVANFFAISSASAFLTPSFTI